MAKRKRKKSKKNRNPDGTINVRAHPRKLGKIPPRDSKGRFRSTQDDPTIRQGIGSQFTLFG